MKQLFQITTLVLISILIIGCSSNNANKNKSNSKTVDTIKKEIKDIDKNLGYEVPLGIDSVKLMNSGKVILVTSDDTIENEEITISLDVKDIYIFNFGNGGYRSIILLKNDGTVSAINSSALIENKQIEVIDNLGNYTDVVSVKQEKDQESFLIYAVQKNNNKLLLDGYIK